MENPAADIVIKDGQAIIVPQAGGQDIRVSVAKVAGSTSTADSSDSSSNSLKGIVNPDSLYKYTSWEDPARTIGSYVGIMTILLGAHYLPLTQAALKVGATTLGVAATVEYVHRSFTSNTILARLRPNEYKKIPEPVLNDTLKDIHDLVQRLVVEAQKIILGQDLGRTFVGFIGLSALYWLVKILSPFALVLLGVTTLYIAPLLQSRRGREVIEDATHRAADLGSVALENSQALANDGKAKAAELYSKAQETAADTKRRVGELAQSGGQTAADMSSQLRAKASDVTGTAEEKASSMSQSGKNAVNQASDKTTSALGNANQRMHSAHPDGFQKDSQNDTENKLDHIPEDTDNADNHHSYTQGYTHSAVDTDNSHYELKGSMEGARYETQQLPRQNVGANSVLLSDPILASDGDQAGTHGIMGRPRGVPLSDLDGGPGFSQT